MSDNQDDLNISNVSNTDAFTPQSRRNLIEFTISKAIRLGYSKSAALQSYRDAGLGITRSDFNDIYDRVSALDVASERIQDIAPYELPTTQDLGKANFPLDSNYMFTALFTINDYVAETQSTQFLSVKTNNLQSKEDILSYILEKYRDSFDPEEFEILDVRVVRGYYK